MRKTLICWLVGIVGIGSIAGCGIFRCSSKECGGSKCSPGILQKKKCDTCQATKAKSPAAAGKAVSDDSWRNKAPKVAAGMESTPVQKKLPTGDIVVSVDHQVPTGKKSDAPTREKYDALAEENAILQREVAALRSRPAAKPSAPESNVSAQSLVEPAVKPSAPESNVSAQSLVEPATALRQVPSSTPTQIVPEPAKPAATPTVGAEKEKTVELKNVHIQYGQVDNYKTVTGQVQAYRKMLRLRYAAIDQEDAHGGVVVLEGAAELSQIRDGQHIRVTGVLIPAETRTGTAHYRVQAIEVLD